MHNILKYQIKITLQGTTKFITRYYVNGIFCYKKQHNLFYFKSSIYP